MEKIHQRTRTLKKRTRKSTAYFEQLVQSALTWGEYSALYPDATVFHWLGYGNDPAEWTIDRLRINRSWEYGPDTHGSIRNMSDTASRRSTAKSKYIDKPLNIATYEPGEVQAETWADPLPEWNAATTIQRTGRGKVYTRTPLWTSLKVGRVDTDIFPWKWEGVEPLIVEEAMTKAIAKTSPERAAAMIPVTLFESVELPALWRLAKEAGIVRKLAAGNLAYQFAIAPTIGDVMAMLSLEKHTHKRTLEWIRATLPRGLRKRAIIQQRVVYHRWPNFKRRFESPIGELTCWDLRRVRKVNDYVVIRWQMTPESWRHLHQYLMSEEVALRHPALRQEIQRTLAGFKVGAQLEHVWELVPFSWLVDYFVKVGEFLSLTRNSMAFAPSSINVIREVEVYDHYRKLTVRDPPSNAEPRFFTSQRLRYRGSVTPQKYTWVQRRQIDPGTIPELRINRSMFSWKQMTILHSLLHLLTVAPPSKKK